MSGDECHLAKLKHLAQPSPASVIDAEPSAHMASYGGGRHVYRHKRKVSLRGNIWCWERHVCAKVLDKHSE